MSRPSLTRSLRDLCARIHKMLSPLVFRPGVHTSIYLQSAGFKYTGEGDTACCTECGLKVSNWTVDMKPFTIHSQRKPDCPFVLSLQSPIPLSPAIFRDVSEREAVQPTDSQLPSDQFIETQVLRNIRTRTFSHWPHRENLSSKRMTDAGFFSSTIDDRVTCIYCNLTCHRWTPHVDDPCEVHKTLSPRCVYVKNFLSHHGHIPTINDNGNSIRLIPSSFSTSQNNMQSMDANDFVPRVQQDNSNGTRSSSLSVDDMIQAEYIHTRKNNNMHCAVCDGRLDFSGSNEHIMIKHARQYPHCAYARQFFGVGPFQKIEDLHRAILLLSYSNSLRNSRQSQRADSDELSKRIATGLNLSMSQRILRQNMPPDIIRECWKRQLSVKHEDFESEGDLYVACLTLKKERRYTQNDPDKIVIPCSKMRELEQNAKNEYLTRLAVTGHSNVPLLLDPCVVCSEEKKRLACIPCGHLATCVPCGHSLRSCPLCRRKIEAFVRIYV